MVDYSCQLRDCARFPRHTQLKAECQGNLARPPIWHTNYSLTYPKQTSKADVMCQPCSAACVDLMYSACVHFNCYYVFILLLCLVIMCSFCYYVLLLCLHYAIMLLCVDLLYCIQRVLTFWTELPKTLARQPQTWHRSLTSPLLCLQSTSNTSVLCFGIGRLLPHCYVSNRPATHLCCVVPSVLHSACVDLAVELPTMSPIDQQHICAVLSLQLNACPLSVASCQESPVQLQIWHRWAACYINSHLYRHFKLGTGEQRVTVHRWAAVAQCTGEQR